MNIFSLTDHGKVLSSLSCYNGMDYNDTDLNPYLTAIKMYKCYHQLGKMTKVLQNIKTKCSVWKV